MPRNPTIEGGDGRDAIEELAQPARAAVEWKHQVYNASQALRLLAALA
jgi:hypothetical protein